MKASVKYFWVHTREILNTACHGEEVIITFRGKTKVRILPFNAENNNVTRKIKLFGIWKDNDRVKDVDQYVRNIRGGECDDCHYYK